jgi:hypothetical protein
MMEHDHGYSMEAFYEQCESWLWKGIGEEILREQRDEEKINIYDVGWSGEGRFFFGEKMKLSFWIFLITSKNGMDFKLWIVIS